MELLKTLYNISSPSGSEGDMIDFLLEHLEGRGIKAWKDEVGNVYAIKGKAKTYPCIVAHTDEVHEPKPDGFKVVEQYGVLFGYDFDKIEPCGIGADDKNGIWVALRLLDELPALKAAFFVEEEIGCGGSSVADISFFDDCRYVVQCDKSNNSFFVTDIYGTELCSKGFIKACSPEKYGYKETDGALTDVYTLKSNGLGVSVVNISCGYYNPHTSQEATSIADLTKCYRFAKHICSLKNTFKHKCKVKPHGFYGSFYPYYSYNMGVSNKSKRISEEDRLKEDLRNDIFDWYCYNTYDVPYDDDTQMLYNAFKETLTKKEIDLYGDLLSLTNFEDILFSLGY